MRAAIVVAILLLSVFTAATALGTASLYRMVERSASPAGTLLKWPFQGLRPGQSFTDVLGGSWPSTGFYVFAAPDVDAFSASVSTSIVASAWGVGTTVVLRGSDGSADWVTQLHSYHDLSVVPVSSSDFAQLGISVVPVVALLRDGVVVDAVSGLVSPSAIADFFRLTAAPSLSGLRNLGLELQ